MKIMGTGSRSAITSKSPTPKEIYRELEDYVCSIAARANIVLISGMAEGWDEMIAAVGYRNDLPYICVLPTKDYTNYYWARSLTGEDRRSVAKMYMDAALDVVFLEDTYGAPYYLRRGPGVNIPGPNYNIEGTWIHANMLRNQLMVDICDGALVFEAGSAGTKDAVARLKKAKKPYETFPFNDHLMFDLASGF